MALVSRNRYRAKLDVRRAKPPPNEGRRDRASRTLIAQLVINYLGDTNLVYTEAWKFAPLADAFRETLGRFLLRQ